MDTLIKYKYYLLGVFCLPFLFVFFAWVTTPSTDNIKSCFTTSFNKVDLCPTNDNYVTLNLIPQHFIDSLLVAEDAGFFGHKGVDFFEILESLKRNLKQKGFKRGGSTISQQLAKNLYLSADKSILRKLREYFVTRNIEKQLSKNQILEKYINVVEFGPNLFGIKAASLHYFGKLPSSLSFYESLLLVHVLPNPKKYGPYISKGALSEWGINKSLIHLERLITYKKIDPSLYLQLRQRFIGMSDGSYVDPAKEGSPEAILGEELAEPTEDVADNEETPEDSEPESLEETAETDQELTEEEAIEADIPEETEQSEY